MTARSTPIKHLADGTPIYRLTFDVTAEDLVAFDKIRGDAETMVGCFRRRLRETDRERGLERALGEVELALAGEVNPAWGDVAQRVCEAIRRAAVRDWARRGSPPPPMDPNLRAAS